MELLKLLGGTWAGAKGSERREAARQQEKEERRRKVAEETIRGEWAEATSYSKNLHYQAKLPSFTVLAEGKHEDVRALAYAMRSISPQKKWPITKGDFDTGDFNSEKEGRQALQKRGLIKPMAEEKALTFLYEKAELKDMLQSNGLPASGKKADLAERLLEAGIPVKTKRGLYELTAKGIEVITEYEADYRKTVQHAVAAMMSMNYREAASIYREYDNRWGYLHKSGKAHTIFAHYEIPYSRFRFIENYPMNELNNTAAFKRTLRACVLAGFLRGVENQWELVNDFKGMCEEKIACPNLISLFAGYSEYVLREMKAQSEFSADNALEYYISNLLYLSRQADR